MRPRTLALNILLPTCIGIATITAWFWATGSTAVSLPVVVGLAFFAGGAAAVADWLGRHTVHAIQRRTHPARHRKPTTAPTIEGEV